MIYVINEKTILQPPKKGRSGNERDLISRRSGNQFKQSRIRRQNDAPAASGAPVVRVISTLHASGDAEACEFSLKLTAQLVLSTILCRRGQTQQVSSRDMW